MTINEFISVLIEAEATLVRKIDLIDEHLRDYEKILKENEARLRKVKNKNFLESPSLTVLILEASGLSFSGKRPLSVSVLVSINENTGAVSKKVPFDSNPTWNEEKKM